MNNEVKKILTIIDTALKSDNENVKTALREFMVIVSLCEETVEDGPLCSLFEEIEMLKNRLNRVELGQSSRTVYGGPYPKTGTDYDIIYSINDNTATK